MFSKAWWLPRRGILQDPSRWGLLGMLALLALAGAYFFGGRADTARNAGPPPSPAALPLPAPAPGAAAESPIPEEAARMLAESERVGLYLETLREIHADIVRSRGNPCGSPLLFVLVAGTWRIGSRGAFLPIDRGDLPPGWHQALQRRARMGQRVVAEADLYRAEGNC